MTSMLALACLMFLGVDGGSSDGGWPDRAPPNGTSWVIRPKWSGGNSGWSQSDSGDGGPVRNGQIWQALCEPIVLELPTLRLGDEFTLRVRNDRVLEPSFTSRQRRSARAEGRCNAPWPRQPVYASAQECRAALPSRLRRTCVGQDCSWDTEPWLLEGCEPEMQRLRSFAGIATVPTHAEAVRALRRFEAILERGGTMWGVPGCEPVKFDARDRDGMTHVSIHTLHASWEAFVALEPLFGVARYASEFGVVDGGGGWGGTGGAEVILLGKDRVALGNRELVFAPKQCASP